MTTVPDGIRTRWSGTSRAPTSALGGPRSTTPAACLRNADNQRYAAIKGGLPPTIESLYGDPTLRKSYPFADTILEGLRNASTRPLTPAYTNVSLEIQSVLSPPSHINPDPVVPQLRKGIEDAINSRGLVP